MNEYFLNVPNDQSDDQVNKDRRIIIAERIIHVVLLRFFITVRISPLLLISFLPCVLLYLTGIIEIPFD